MLLELLVLDLDFLITVIWILLICFVFKIGSYRVSKDGLELTAQARIISSLSTHLLLYAVFTGMSHSVQLFDLWELQLQLFSMRTF